ncbi:hypothetical protein AB1N83_014077, partial [Pleurotus pulmonarius]
SVTL